MKTLMLKRFKDSFQLSIVLAAIPLVIEFVCGIRFEGAFLIPMFMGAFAFCMFVSMKTSWYLGLPLSRKKLIRYHVIESGLNSLTLLLMFSISSAAILRHQHQSLGVLLLLPFMAIVVMAMGSIAIVKPANQLAAVNNLGNRSMPEYWKTQLFNWKFISVIVWILLIAISKDPWMVALLFVAFCSQIPQSSLKAIAYPSSSFRKIQKVFTACGVALSIILMAGAYSVVTLAPENTIFPSLAFRFLGHLPIPVSHDRADDLFQSPRTELSVAALAVFRRSSFSVSEQDWRRKVDHCASETCLELAERIVPSGRSKPDADLKIFEALIDRCHPRFDRESKVRCAGARLSDRTLDRWITKLVASAELNVWLGSSDPNLQITALKALTFEQPTDEQSAKIKALARSEDKFVRSAAIDNLSFDRARLEKGKPSAALLF